MANLGPAVSGLTGPAGDPVTDGLASYDWSGDGTSTYQHYLEGWRPLLESLPVHGFLGHLIGAGCPCGGGIHDRLSGGNERA